MARQTARSIKRPATRRKPAEAPSAEAMGDNYEEMSVEELSEIIERATAVRDSKIDGERDAFIEDTRRRAAVLGVSISLGGGERKRGRKAKAGGSSDAVKYRGPNDETWTGRGRKPAWLAALEAEGKSREEFLVRP